MAGLRFLLGFTICRFRAHFSSTWRRLISALSEPPCIWNLRLSLRHTSAERSLVIILPLYTKSKIHPAKTFWMHRRRNDPTGRIRLVVAILCWCFGVSNCLAIFAAMSFAWPFRTTFCLADRDGMAWINRAMKCYAVNEVAKLISYWYTVCHINFETVSYYSLLYVIILTFSLSGINQHFWFKFELLNWGKYGCKLFDAALPAGPRLHSSGTLRRTHWLWIRVHRAGRWYQVNTVTYVYIYADMYVIIYLSIYVLIYVFICFFLFCYVYNM